MYIECMEKIVNVSLRLTEALHMAITDLAASEHRSLHGQIVFLIEQATGTKDTAPRRRRRNRKPPTTADGGAGA